MAKRCAVHYTSKKMMKRIKSINIILLISFCIPITFVGINDSKVLGFNLKNNELNSDTIIHLTLTGTATPFADKAEYGIYIPTQTEALRGILILQHGCGMEQFGITRPYDLQYQALAKKWNLAIIETALYGSCYDWKEPKNGTYEALLKVLKTVADKTAHPELNTVPWLLWGHSGGGYWTLGMLKEHPERIMAAVCYSPAFNPQWDYPKEVRKIPVFIRHAGANDSNSSDGDCWNTALHTFSKLRELDAYAAIACNPQQNHNLSYLRYMAIPFYEAVLKQRLPDVGETTMKDMSPSQAWLGDTLSLKIYKESDFAGDKKGLCRFPDELTAKNWQEYVSTGTVRDKTPPSKPYNVKITKHSNGLDITWKADADIESGILCFEIFKEGNFIGRIPETGAFQNFDTNGDNTISPQVPPMKFRIDDVQDGTISIQTVNHAQLKSEKATATYK